MNQVKAGIYTTEFWLTAVTNLVGAILAILAAYGVIKAEYQELWLTLVQAVAVAVIPIALAIVNQSYINSRAEIKSAHEIARNE